MAIISAHQVENVVVITIAGRITCGVSTDQLHDAVHEWMSKGHKNFVLDLAEVGSIDSSCMGELVDGYKAANSIDGQLKLLNLTPRVLELLKRTKLDTVFEVFTDLATAIRSFRV